MSNIRGACRFRRQDGQVLPLVMLAMVVLLLLVGFAIDMGRVFEARSELQSAVDAAALAAGEQIPSTTASYNAAINMDAQKANTLTGYGVTAGVPTVTFQCDNRAPGWNSATTKCLTDTSTLTGANKTCTANGQGTEGSTAVNASDTCNTVNIKESGSVSITLLGVKLPKSFTFNLTASATAGARGPGPADVEVILDTTASVVSHTCDTSNHPALYCEKDGVRAMLGALTPCITIPCSGTPIALPNSDTGAFPELGNTYSGPDDQVGLLLFPAMEINPTVVNPSPQSLKSTNDLLITDRGYETQASPCQSETSAIKVTYPWYQSYSLPTTPIQTTNTSAGGNVATVRDYDGFAFTVGLGTLPVGDVQPGYEVVGLSNDYDGTSGTSAGTGTSLLTSSPLVAAVNLGTNCGLQDVSGVGSYLAGAITEAQYLLNQAPSTVTINHVVTEVQKDIVVISDGDMNDPSSKVSGQLQNDGTPCQSAVNSAAQAKLAGTTIFAVEYGPSSSCDSGLTGATTMRKIASTTGDFYPSPSYSTLTSDFQDIGITIANSRLFTDCSATTAGGC